MWYTINMNLSLSGIKNAFCIVSRIVLSFIAIFIIASYINNFFVSFVFGSPRPQDILNLIEFMAILVILTVLYLFKFAKKAISS